MLGHLEGRHHNCLGPVVPAQLSIYIINVIIFNFNVIFDVIIVGVIVVVVIGKVSVLNLRPHRNRR